MTQVSFSTLTMMEKSKKSDFRSDGFQCPNVKWLAVYVIRFVTELDSYAFGEHFWSADIHIVIESHINLSRKFE